jgi:hypothetical protein
VKIRHMDVSGPNTILKGQTIPDLTRMIHFLLLHAGGGGSCTYDSARDGDVHVPVASNTRSLCLVVERGLDRLILFSCF